jgi:sugar fermentation stimulation protein A
MKFKTPLHEGKFIKRYKRFFADIELNHEIIVAHTANTGSMKTCLGERWPVFVKLS